MKVKEESEKVDLKLNIQKTKIMASDPITSWEIDGETVETVSDFIFLGSKITADGDCSQEIKRHLLLGRKVMTNLDSILKSRDIICQQTSVWSRRLFFQWSCMDVRVELWRKLSTEKLMLLNCGVGEDSWESLGLQGDPTSSSERRSVLGVHWKVWCWSWNSSTLATTHEELTHWKRPWFWDGLGAGGEGDDRGWDGWMASPTRWTWVWVNSGGWWWTGRPGVLRFRGSQRVGHDWVTELNWTDIYTKSWRSQTQASKSVLPAEWNRTYLSTPTMSYHNTYERLAIRAGKAKICAQGFHWELVR